MKFIFKILAVSLLTFSLVSCGSSSDDEGSASSSYYQLVIGHNSGVDFSKNQVTGVEWEKQDGYTTAWSPTAYVEGEKWGSGMWYSNNVSDDTATYYFMQNLGNVSLDSVTNVDTTAWLAHGAAIHSLEVGKVYVVKVKDGYVKFKVLSVTDSSDTEWEFKVEYKYSSTTSF